MDINITYTAIFGCIKNDKIVFMNELATMHTRASTYYYTF